ncbi:MAG TPA: hypothetical protein VHG72_00445 [Polyangia bacterium]|nr:hypothetical protein [Polyangia bacterium]
MRTLGFWLLAGALGCATTQPFVPSDRQRADFDDLVRKAEAAGALDGPPEAAARLADAKSEFTYAQHIPLYPERARGLAAKAQSDAELALALARQHQSDVALFARAAAHFEAITDPPAAPPSTVATASAAGADN